MNNNFPCCRQTPDSNMMPNTAYTGPMQYPGTMYQPSPAVNQLPTGLPAGPHIVPPPAIPSATNNLPQSVQNVAFTPGFLRTLIGSRIRVEFLIGTNAPLIDRIGTLLEVGASYIVIRLSDTDDYQMCDLYSIKFVTIYK